MELKNAVLFLLLTGWIQLVLCIEPLSGFYALGAALTSTGIASYNVILCRFYECCDDRWIVNNLTGMSGVSISIHMGYPLACCSHFFFIPRRVQQLSH